MLLWSKCGLSEKGKCIILIPIPADTGKRRQLLTHVFKTGGRFKGFWADEGYRDFCYRHLC
jgi:hypothetical protein